MSSELTVLDADQIKKSLPWPVLVDALEAMFIRGCEMPLRHHHSIHVPGEEDATLLLMPAWVEGGYLGVKMANVFPSNRKQSVASISANYLLSCGQTGKLLSIMDAGELTARRTAAASVLAAKYLLPQKQHRHLMVGTGRLSAALIQAYASTFGITDFTIWGRNSTRSAELAETLSVDGLKVTSVPQDALDQAVAEATIISCATMSHEPLIRGELLQPGTHVDLVGSFTPTMREADNTVMQRGKIFVDTREGAMKESGDLAIPLNTGILQPEDILADLSELCQKTHAGRADANDITVFKAVGAACEDLAAAIVVYRAVSR